MATASIQNIKRRIKSIEGTMQITNAMELVATSKMIRAQDIIRRSRPYYQMMYQTLTDILNSNTDFSSDFTRVRSVKKTCYILIAGDRGLAGGYNSNVIKKMEKEIADKTVCILPIGKKALEYCKRTNKEIYSDQFGKVEDITINTCSQIGVMIAESFVKNEFDELFICFTNFVSMLEQSPIVMPVLPLNSNETQDAERSKSLILYEPSSESVFDAIIPGYLAGLVYGTVCEAMASELAARRTAMHTASNNADEMIQSLSLQYNQARQSAITQEITEIVAGSGE